MAGVSGELHTSDTFGVGGVKPSQALTCCNFPYLQCEGDMERGWVGEVESEGWEGKMADLNLAIVGSRSEHLTVPAEAETQHGSLH